MLEVSKIVAELSKIGRERAIIKTSLIPDELKIKLIAQLDERAARVGAELSPPPQGAKKG